MSHEFVGLVHRNALRGFVPMGLARTVALSQMRHRMANGGVWCLPWASSVDDQRNCLGKVGFMNAKFPIHGYLSTRLGNKERDLK